MTIQSLLLDDYGMYLLSRLSDIWSDVRDVPLRVPQCEASRQEQNRASLEFATAINGLVEHMILLVNAPDIAPQRLEDHHRLLTGRLVEVITEAAALTLIEQREHSDQRLDALIMAQCQATDEIILLLDLIRVESGKEKSFPW